MGNTPDIAMRHYLLVTERDFARAACNDPEPNNARTGGAESGAVLAQNEAQHAPAPICTESQLLSQTLTQLEVMQTDAISCDPLLTPPQWRRGLLNTYRIPRDFTQKKTGNATGNALSNELKLMEFSQRTGAKLDALHLKIFRMMGPRQQAALLEQLQ